MSDILLLCLYCVRPQDEEGRTPLHFAADRGRSAAIACLLALGAAVDPRDEDGMTPLAYAVTCEHEKEIELLVRLGVGRCVFLHRSKLRVNREWGVRNTYICLCIPPLPVLQHFKDLTLTSALKSFPRRVMVCIL